MWFHDHPLISERDVGRLSSLQRRRLAHMSEASAFCYMPNFINTRERTNPGSVESDSISSLEGARSRSVTT